MEVPFKVHGRASGQLLSNRLKKFAKEYSSVIAILASVLSISYYSFLLTGGNLTLLYSIFIVGIVLITILIFSSQYKQKKLKQV